MSSLIVPLDGSPLSESALRVAFAVAARGGGRVVAVRAAEGEVDEVRSYLEAAVRRFDRVAPHDIRVLAGRPADAILAAAAGGDDLVCMATHGRGGVSRLALGSVTEEVVRRSEREVLLVGPAGASVPLAGEAGELLVCSDGSDASAAILGPAAAFARRLDLASTVVQVIPPDEAVAPHGDAPPRPRLHRAERGGDERCRALEASGATATSKVLWGNDPVRVIEGFARSLPASFIALATHGRSGLVRYTLGSVATGIVKRAPCPVLVVRAPNPAPAG
jgi:nucleotide-binding universal stress UspA family protein